MKDKTLVTPRCGLGLEGGGGGVLCAQDVRCAVWGVGENAVHRSGVK